MLDFHIPLNFAVHRLCSHNCLKSLSIENNTIQKHLQRCLLAVLVQSNLEFFAVPKSAQLGFASGGGRPSTTGGVLSIPVHMVNRNACCPAIRKTRVLIKRKMFQSEGQADRRRTPPLLQRTPRVDCCHCASRGLCGCAARNAAKFVRLLRRTRRASGESNGDTQTSNICGHTSAMPA